MVLSLLTALGNCVRFRDIRGVGIASTACRSYLFFFRRCSVFRVSNLPVQGPYGRHQRTLRHLFFVVFTRSILAITAAHSIFFGIVEWCALFVLRILNYIVKNAWITRKIVFASVAVCSERATEIRYPLPLHQSKTAKRSFDTFAFYYWVAA